MATEGRGNTRRRELKGHELRSPFCLDVQYRCIALAFIVSLDFCSPYSFSREYPQIDNKRSKVFSSLNGKSWQSRQCRGKSSVKYLTVCGVELYSGLSMGSLERTFTGSLLFHGRHHSFFHVKYIRSHKQSCQRVNSVRTCSPAAPSLKRLPRRSQSLLEALLAIEQRRLSTWYLSPMPLIILSIADCRNTGRKVRRGRMRSRRRTLPRTAGGRRKEMEHIPTRNRRTEDQGEESRTMESVPA